MKIRTRIVLFFILAAWAGLGGLAVTGGHGSLASALISRPDAGPAQEEPVRPRTEPEPVRSSWDDLLAGVKTLDDWRAQKEVLRRRYLELIRDAEKPARPPLDLVVHESVNVDGVYLRKLISYNVEADERAHAYLAVPIGLKGPARRRWSRSTAPTPSGKEREAGLLGAPEKAFLDHFARRRATW